MITRSALISPILPSLRQKPQEPTTPPSPEPQMGAWKSSGGPATGHRLLQQEHRLDLGRNVSPETLSLAPSKGRLSVPLPWTNSDSGQSTRVCGLGSFVVSTHIRGGHMAARPTPHLPATLEREWRAGTPGSRQAPALWNRLSLLPQKDVEAVLMSQLKYC